MNGKIAALTIFVLFIGSFAVTASSAEPTAHIDIYEAKIGTSKELEAYMLETPANQNPIKKLSEDGQSAFLTNLVWTDSGLGGLNTYPLKIELTSDEAFEILSLFGLQKMVPLLFNGTGSNLDSELDAQYSNLPQDPSCPLIENYRCKVPATCTYSRGDICITCNCGMQEP